HAAFRLDVGAELVQPPAYLGLELSEPQVVSGDELVLTALELLRHGRDTMLQPLCAGVSDVSQALGEHGLRLSRKGADGALQLACEALRSVLARGFHQGSEPQGSLVRVRRHRAVDGTLELLDLPARKILEPAAHALHRVGLLALRLLQQLALAA